MKEYLIQGLLGVFTNPDDSEPLDENSSCPDGTGTDKYIAVGVGYRIEVWDKDNRFDDRLGIGKTTDLELSQVEEKGPINWGKNKGSYFEIRFSDESLRQESGETETIESSELFFKVFKGSQFLFKTKPKNLSEDNLKDRVDECEKGEDGFCYKIAVCIYKIETQEEDEPPTDDYEKKFFNEDDQVVDILPTADQIYNLGRQSTVTNTNTSPGGSLQQVVDNAFGRVLGQTFRTGNIKNFRDSLSQTFAIQENNGQRKITYNPGSYTTQTELGGAITGAQASLYHRAKAALKEILSLLDGIYELEAASDKQNRDAIRSIIRTEIIEVVNEMGLQKGPRVQRVNSLFQLLVGDESQSRLPEQIGGQLRDFARAFGLERSRINTVDEERNYGNFLIIRDYIVSLKKSWQDYVSLQMAGGGSFIGTQLVLLSQALSVMAESVKETYRIMDLVFLGPEERESVLIDFTQAEDQERENPEIAFLLPDGTLYSKKKTAQLVPAMEVEKLLSWAMRFATEEGPTLARTGGKLGIAKAIAKTANTLMILLQAASYTPVPNSAFRRAGVKRALRDLAFQTYRVKQLADELIPPLLSGEADDVGDRFLGSSEIFYNQ